MASPVLVLFLLISVYAGLIIYNRLQEGDPLLTSYLIQMVVLLLILCSALIVSHPFSTWFWGILSFLALREFLSLTDLRLQDRIGVLFAYLSIPFMMTFIYSHWYTMFIITIPVYSFLVIPLGITLGGRPADGAVFSIGVIDLGLFLLVFCMGHLAFLSYYTLWLAVALVLNTTVSELLSRMIQPYLNRKSICICVQAILPMPFTVLITAMLADWIHIPYIHAVIIGLIIPVMVALGNHAVGYLELDLRIEPDLLKPGCGLLIHDLKAVLYTAPIVLHYYRYFIL